PALGQLQEARALPLRRDAAEKSDGQGAEEGSARPAGRAGVTSRRPALSTRMARIQPARGARPAQLEIADGVAWVTLGGARIDASAAQALCDAAERIGFDESVGVAVIQGSAGTFCLGVEGGGEWETRHDWVAAVGALAVPVVAAIAGDAIAEGA